MAGGKTLHLSSLDPRRTSERTIYNEFSPYGFIRRIALKGSYAFVEFDTLDDAERALSIFTGRKDSVLDGYRVGVTYARNEHRVENTKLSLRLADVLPEGHKFWRQLQRMCADH
jgi:RNA recognition motif-containing protein